MENMHENINVRVANLELQQTHILDKAEMLEERFATFERRVDRHMETTNEDVADIKAIAMKTETAIEYLAKAMDNLGSAIKENSSKANVAYERTERAETIFKTVFKIGSIAATVVAAAWAVYTQLG